MNRRLAIKRVVGAVGALKLWDTTNLIGGPQAVLGAYRIQSSQITAYLNRQGEVTALVLAPVGGKPLARKVQGHTVLAGCTARHVTAGELGGGGVEFTKSLVHDGDGRSCTLTERFLPAKSGSVRWEFEILGDGAPWSTPIETHLAWPITADTKFWTTWGDSRPENSAGWNDPLISASFADRSLHYGASDIWKSQGFSVPVATLLDTTNDAGLSLALDPGDRVIELDLSTTPAGEMVFVRTNNRISKDRPVRFALDLVSHPSDWRAALGWMTSRYPDFFDPPNPLTFQVAGNAAYAEYEGTDLDAYKFHSMGFRVNWKASFDFYTMGLFLPPVGAEVEYVSPRIGDGTPEFPTSIAHLREYSEQMRRSGFYVLNYFNVGEFGHTIHDQAPAARETQDDADLWRDPNEFAWYVLKDAMLYDDQGNIRHGWQSDVLVDVGEPIYARLMLEQARRHIQAFPASSGLCLDEMQFLRNYNPRRDDGLTWRDGNPARAMVNSWKDFMSKLGPVMREANKVIYANPLYRRLDLMRHLDGFYDEFGSLPYSLNTNSFLAVRKPYLAWTVDLDPDPDAYFQRHLYLGANVSAPYPMNNHNIMPSGSKVDRYFVDYGPLFDAMRGRTWVLKPHAVEVEGQKAKANLFAIPGGHLAFVTFGGDSNSAKLVLGGLPKLDGQSGFLIEVIHPGETEWSALSGNEQGDILALQVPLQRGCAAVKLSYLWIKPARQYFIKDHTVTLGTTVNGAQIRYTLDGTEPTINSSEYTQPFTVDATTTLKVAAFRGGSRICPRLIAELVKTRPPAPWIDPFQGTFTDHVSVEIRNAYPLEGTEIRYTLDGGEVTPQSPLYSGPIDITETTTVRTKLFVPGLEPSVSASRQFSKLAPVPPSPDVYLAELTPLKSTVVWHYKPTRDRSVENTPLGVAGRKFEHGLGVASPSSVTYKLEPNYGTFVAVTGLDDNVKSRYADMATFRVYVRNEREELLLHRSPMLYPGESWPMAVKIPLDSQEIRLEVNGGMDWERVDWANAGFLLDHTNRGEELLKEVTSDN